MARRVLKILFWLLFGWLPKPTPPPPRHTTRLNMTVQVLAPAPDLQED